MNLRRDTLTGVRAIIEITRDLAWRLRMAHLSRRLGKRKRSLSFIVIGNVQHPLNKWHHAGIIMGYTAGICIPVYTTEDGEVRASPPKE